MSYKKAVKQVNKLIDSRLAKCVITHHPEIPLQMSAMGRMRQEHLEATSAYMDEVVLAAEDVLAWYEAEIGVRLSRYPACAKRLKKALKRLKEKEDELDGQAH